MGLYNRFLYQRTCLSYSRDLQAVVVQLSEAQHQSVEAELAKYDFSAINSKSSKINRFNTGCAFFSPEFIVRRIMSAVNALAAEMTADMEPAFMQGNTINVTAPELDTLLRLRTEIEQAKELIDLFSSRKKISLKNLRVSEGVSKLLGIVRWRYAGSFLSLLWVFGIQQLSFVSA